jgi:hypothetical protein
MPLSDGVGTGQQAFGCEEERLCSGDVDLTVDDTGLCTVIDGSVSVSGQLRYPMPCVHTVTMDVSVLNNAVLTNLTGLEVSRPPTCVSKTLQRRPPSGHERRKA